MTPLLTVNTWCSCNVFLGNLQRWVNGPLILWGWWFIFTSTFHFDKNWSQPVPLFRTESGHCPLRNNCSPLLLPLDSVLSLCSMHWRSFTSSALRHWPSMSEVALSITINTKCTGTSQYLLRIWFGRSSVSSVLISPGLAPRGRDRRFSGGTLHSYGSVFFLGKWMI